MSDDERREGDERDFDRDPKVSLTLLPAKGQKIRWLPRQGDPLCIIEWASQHVVRAVAFIPVYTAIIATLTLVILIFGAPWGWV